MSEESAGSPVMVRFGAREQVNECGVAPNYRHRK
jgi:hypothetical protein